MAVGRLLWTFVLISAFSTCAIARSPTTIEPDTTEADTPSTNTEPSTSPITTTEELYRMDMIPTGSLPDNVYRELAWYGILQIQPIPASIKNRMVSKLIWQHALGRPHVLLNLNVEHPGPYVETRKSISEKGASWARLQEAKKLIMLEAMRRGGNGVTVRTVVGANKVSEFIITSGIQFYCEEGRVRRHIFHDVERRTHVGACVKPPAVIYDGVRAVDECLEAEFATMEYSHGEGWVYCMGQGERDRQKMDNGMVDCGTKTKVPYKQVLGNCAIDGNVVIKFEYYGDMPRKDIIQDQTICLTWSPCTLWYLYRLEPPPEMAAEVTEEEATCIPEGETPCIGCMVMKVFDDANSTTNKPSNKPWIEFTTYGRPPKKPTLGSSGGR